MDRSGVTVRAIGRLAAAAVTLVALTSCGSDGGSSTSEPGASTTMPAVSTTVPSVAGAAETAWDAFIRSFVVIDASAVSNGPCGPRAVLLTEGSVTTYWWDGVRWNDDTSILDGPKGEKPSRVYTHDFTNDGVDDFAVVYDDNVRRTGNRYVAIIGYPWSKQDECKWRWMDIDNGLDTNKRFEISGIDTRTWRIHGVGYVHRRLSGGYIAYLPASSAFVFVPSAKKK